MPNTHISINDNNNARAIKKTKTSWINWKTITYTAAFGGALATLGYIIYLAINDPCINDLCEEKNGTFTFDKNCTNGHVPFYNINDAPKMLLEFCKNTKDWALFKNISKKIAEDSCACAIDNAPPPITPVI